jgi:hypothetical protein
MEYYDGLLELCGFGASEIVRERPRMEKTFQKLEIGPADISHAENWVRRHHDVELKGVRQILRLWLYELCDLVLARDEGKKIIYYGFPTISGPAQAIAASAADIHCTCPDVVLCYTLGQIFNKLTPVLEAGEANGLPQGHSLCTLQVVRVGGMALGIVPVPDLVLTSSYYCDMGSKADELLHQRYGHPAVYVDGCRDPRWGEFPGYPPTMDSFLAAELEKIFNSVREILGVEVSEEARYEGARRSRDVFGALGELNRLMMTADPQPISVVTVEMARRLTNGSASRRIISEAPGAIRTLISEVKERIKKGYGVVEKGAPRAMIILAHFSDPSLMHMMEGCGLSIPTTTFVYTATSARKPLDYISGETLAETEMGRGSFHSTYGLIKRATEAVRASRVDGLIWNYIYNCRPIALSSHLAKQFVEEETGVPVLSLEMDMYDSRAYSAEALRTRVETFAEMLRARKAASG